MNNATETHKEGKDLMKHMVGITVVNFIISVVFVGPAYAYLDPGTGSMLIQAVIAIVAAGSLFISMFWKRVKGFLNRLYGKKQETGEHRHDE
jgi:Na+/proline symporter